MMHVSPMRTPFHVVSCYSSQHVNHYLGWILSSDRQTVGQKVEHMTDMSLSCRSTARPKTETIWAI